MAEPVPQDDLQPPLDAADPDATPLSPPFPRELVESFDWARLLHLEGEGGPLRAELARRFGLVSPPCAHCGTLAEEVQRLTRRLDGLGLLLDRLDALGPLLVRIEAAINRSGRRSRKVV